MSSKLIARNADLTRLCKEGYNIDIVGGHLIARDIPYVTKDRRVEYNGILACSLDLNGEITNRPSDHTIKFAGSHPCTEAGVEIEAIRHQSAEYKVTEQLKMQHSFSSKPPCGYYENYYEKIRNYAAILAGYAAQIDPAATAQTFRVVEPQDENSPFEYIDTASARADINTITAKLAVEKVVIVGLGGTGSYVLDLLSKTPVKQIHLYDDDKFSSHNAFRAPGAASMDQLHEQPLKVDYLKAIYGRMHKGVVAHPTRVDAANIEELRGASCVFLCMDSGPQKKFIVEKLEEFGGMFIDVGMGVYAKNERLGGIARVTTSADGSRDAARARLSFSDTDEPNAYDKNIQIADLNALNATLAVIRWKKSRAFYFDLKNERFSSYTVGSNLLLSEDIA